MTSKYFYIYILCNKPRGVLYVGMTSDIGRRMFEHKNALTNGFSKKYNTKILVYFEVAEDYYAALAREKAIKNWKRDWKLEVIEASNPDWRDLSENLSF